MKQMMEKLADKDEHDDHAQHKMEVLHDLRNMAMDMMGDKVRDHLPHANGQHVEVDAKDAAGLNTGLDLAKKMVQHGSLNADQDKGYGESLDSKLPHMGSNKSPMDDAAGDAAESLTHGRNEPRGDEGEPDQSMVNPHRSLSDMGHLDNEPKEEDEYDDLNHDELDQLIEHLKSKKMKRRK